MKRCKTSRSHASRGRSGFLLIESMLAVAIFALAMIGIGKCVEQCIRGQMLIQEDERARRFLSNRMAEIEMGAVLVTDDAKSEDLKDAFEGMTITSKREELKRKDEKDRDILGLYDVKLELTWKFHGVEQSRSLEFYVNPLQQQQ